MEYYSRIENTKLIHAKNDMGKMQKNWVETKPDKKGYILYNSIYRSPNTSTIFYHDGN